MENTCYIYSLEHPLTNDIRYIGKTDNLLKRYSAHLKENETESKRKTKKNSWIKSLLNQNLVPKINIIDIIPFEEWKFWEQFYISLYKSWGFDLTNLTIGGDGGEMPLHIRNKMYKRKKILQYDRQGNFLKEWNGFSAITKEYKTYLSVIWSALNGVRPTAKNYLWRYKISENFSKKI